jgi:hypothetical protein
VSKERTKVGVLASNANALCTALQGYPPLPPPFAANFASLLGVVACAVCLSSAMPLCAAIPWLRRVRLENFLGGDFSSSKETVKVRVLSAVLFDTEIHAPGRN